MRSLSLTSDAACSARGLAGKGVGVFPLGAGATVLARAAAVAVEIGTFFCERGGQAVASEETF